MDPVVALQVEIDTACFYSVWFGVDQDMSNFPYSEKDPALTLQDFALKTSTF